ncbi:MAG: TIR domain-containing protein [Candidatus Lokiarchaeota archaeon]|nr:TIR domain-containing protein [Candidatus Lokiarchaeota archaeon]
MENNKHNRKKIFISYETTDVDRFQIKKLVEMLEEQSDIVEKVYYWQRDTRLGEDFKDYMKDRIKKSDIVLFFCSENALQSRPVLQEIDYTEAYDKNPIPIYEDRQFIPEEIKSRRGLEFDDTHLRQFLDRLLMSLSGTTSTGGLGENIDPLLLKKYNMYITLGDNEFKQTHYGEALSEYKKAVNVAENELYEPNKILKAKELIKKTEALKNAEESYHTLENRAKMVAEQRKWSEAEDIWKQIKSLSSEFGWSERRETAEQQIEEMMLKVKEEEERRRAQRVKEHVQSMRDRGAKQEDNAEYAAAQKTWEELLGFCQQEGLTKYIDEIGEHIKYCEKMLAMAAENSTYVNRGNEAFNDGKYESAIEYFEKSKRLCGEHGWQDGARYASDMINKCNEKMNEPVSYHGTMLARPEQAAMLELESLVGEKILKVSDISYNTFGFTASDSHIKQLGLYRKGLSSLPEIIPKMTWLQVLGLGHNKLSSLPDSIGSLKSLVILRLHNNNLSSLPGRIKKELKTLKDNGCAIYGVDL